MNVVDAPNSGDETPLATRHNGDDGADARFDAQTRDKTGTDDDADKRMGAGTHAQPDTGADAEKYDPLIDAIRAGLRALAVPGRAPQMQAYMKSAMPYLGVRVPQVRSLVRAEARCRPPQTATDLRMVVATLWDDATYREERYAATELLAAPATRGLREPSTIALYERLVVDGAWWDHVDELSHRVGDLLAAFPTEIRPVIVSWTMSPDPWLRRSAIICQLGFRGRTDLDLLSDAIIASAADPGFFLRKAIGWALRDLARTEPGWVRTFVDTHELSPLSVREATKHL